MTNPKSTYSHVLRKVSRETEKKLEKSVQSAIVICGDKLIARTPVDTGAARNHWFIRYQPDEKFDKDAVDKSGAKSKARLKRDVKIVKIGPTYYLVNAAPYFKYLEQGSSRQAPSGVVAITKEELKDIWPKEMRITFSKPV